LDARRWRDQFLQPFPLRSACGIGQSLIGRRLFLKALAIFMAGAFFDLNSIWARRWRDQFPWPFVPGLDRKNGRSPDARRWRDQFLQPFPQRSACGIGQSLIGRRLF
jgi:hypothetical protein